MSRIHRAPRAAAWLALCILAGSLSACGMDKQDLRYRDSRLLPALTVPEGVAGPAYSGVMEIPAAGTSGAAAGDIELPPDLRGGDAGAASAGEAGGE
ncbi:MAG: hypothetical protein IT489_07930 [Gammaproteobacteria bacterium]|nr:hypothetical protein [Gammaproteobacteria bacterium]